MGDLVERLRGTYSQGPFGTIDFSPFVAPISLEAASEIENLTAQIQSLQEELEQTKSRADLFEETKDVLTKQVVGMTHDQNDLKDENESLQEDIKDQIEQKQVCINAIASLKKELDKANEKLCLKDDLINQLLHISSPESARKHGTEKCIASVHITINDAINTPIPSSTEVD